MSKRFPTPKWAGVPTRLNSKAYLEVWKDGVKLTEKLPIGQQACTVLGRNTDVCDFELAHPSISRQHAAIVHTKAGTVEVVDLESAQGTVVDGETLSEKSEFRKAVDNGSEVVFGASTRKYIVRGLNQAPESTIPTRGTSTIAELAQLPTGFATTNSAKQSQKAAERLARDEEIRRLTMEMVTQAPKVQHVATMPKDEDDSSEAKPQPSVRRGPQNNPNIKPKEEEVEDAAVSSDGPESDSDDDDADGESLSRDLALRYNLPLKNQVVLTSHTKSITSIAVDAPGARVATGSMDYHMKLWDFAGMARQVRPFRDNEVEEGHPIMALSYSPTGDRVLAVTGSSQPTVLSREGVKEHQFVKGDMYVMDMVHTKGHTHSCTGGAWHPTLKQSMATCALDGTVRLWKLDGKTAFNKLLNDQVIKFKSKQGKRIEVTTCAYNIDGSVVFGATAEGSVFGYDLRRSTTLTPSLKLQGAHAPGSADLSVSNIKFANEKVFGTRSCSDDCVKLWDIRKLASPLKTLTDVPSHFGVANMAFNATGTAVAVGTSVPSGKDRHGQVLFFDVLTAVNTPLTSIDMQADESAVCVAWHSKINQVFVGSSAGSVRVFYDDAISTRGVLLSATKKLPLASAGYVRIDESTDGAIVNPHALPMFRDANNKKPNKRKYAKIRMDPIASKKPSKPITGPGFGGSTGGGTLTQFFMRDQIKSESIRSEDPREAILKYAKVAEAESTYLGSAYAATQPRDQIAAEYQLAKETLEQEKITKEEETRRLLDL
ncbi:hypothetical protein H310_04979 [Aphanomyces invadans]|uniref:FHA domain-containing protein n=1 Tax=Aphanomyces invadans TaxID=157072 RepID=A0A024UBJ2_9STRA|nr:hypothetical protein H310_04979 [Aphanomyces invadans]ETW03565.1 hypothetical protein H310_04979 [Aphanomyces invadans]|eukprot:XP_008867794.1 hypothetical protein H310_04979 [Aphanomyces invadans]